MSEKKCYDIRKCEEHGLWVYKLYECGDYEGISCYCESLVGTFPLKENAEMVKRALERMVWGE